MAIAPGNKIFQSDMAAFAAQANAKQSLQSLAGTHYPYSFEDWDGIGTNPQWLTTLNNLRGDVANVIANLQLLTGNSDSGGDLPNWIWESISTSPAGGWPLNGANLYHKNLQFYYLDNGSPQYVNVSGNALLESRGQFSSSTQTTFMPPSTPAANNPAGPNFNFNNGSTWTTNLTALQFDSQYTMPYIESHDYEFIIGGSVPLLIQADFYIPLLMVQGSTLTYSGDGSGWPIYAEAQGPYSAGECPVSGTAVPSNTFPDVPTLSNSLPSNTTTSEIIFPSEWNGSQNPPTLNTDFCVAVFHVNATLNPGRYKFSITVSRPAPTYQTVTNGGTTYVTSVTQPPYIEIPQPASDGSTGSDDTMSIAQLNTVKLTSGNPYTLESGGSPVITLAALGPGVACPGISDTSNVLKIDCSTLYEIDDDYSSGLYSVISPETDSDAWLSSPFPQPTFAAEDIVSNLGPFNLSTTTNGLWTGYDAPKDGIGVVSPIDMPWNVQINETNPMAGPTYDSPLENATVPPIWLPQMQFEQGDIILDSSGNLQIVAVTGTSGKTQPTWSSGQGYDTTDGTVTWTCLRSLKVPLTAAVARFQANALGPAPRYPIYWLSETNAFWEAPSIDNVTLTAFGSGKQWLDPSAGWKTTNKAYGWFIYQICVNSEGGTLKNGALLPPGTGGSAQIGCIRNGTFVSFGTFYAGETYQVLWPIFTSDALVYQSSSRLDIQCLAIGAGGSNGLGAVGQPLAATYILDVQALLGFLS